MNITGFGEILWDDLPDGRLLGGAPLNVIARLQALGAQTAIISSRGADADGNEIVRQVAAKNVAADLIQIHDTWPTGVVKVRLDDKGSAAYDIVYPSAWDGIEAGAEAEAAVAQADAFVFGSLAARSETSRRTLERLLPHAAFAVFDANLRPPHYDTAWLLEAMKQADLLKLNDDELFLLAEVYGSPYRSVEQNIVFLADLAGLSAVCVTLGGHGAVLYRDGRFHRHCGFRVDVVDTVGAGDGFLAGLVYRLLQGDDADAALAFACALGALTASRRGATPEITTAQIEDLMNPPHTAQAA